MNSTGKTTSKLSELDGAPVPDPDFDDAIPATPIDPDETEFRDQVLVSNYQQAGALRTELENERLEAEQATLEALNAMRAMDAGDQVKWRISRSGHENDELNGFLESWPNHQMTIERLRDRFGGGTYYCKGFRKGKYFSHQVLQVSGEAKRKPSGVEGVAQSVPVNQAPQFDLQGFMLAQDRRDEKRREQERQERLEREERDEKRRSERLQMIMALGPGALTALGALFQGRQQDLAPLLAAMKGPDPLTMLTQLKALQGNESSGLMAKLIPSLLDAATNRASGGDTGWLDVFKEFAKGAGPAVGGLIEANLRATPAHSIPGLSAPSMGPTENIPTNHPPGLPALSGSPSPGVIVMPESVPRRERRQRSVSGLPRVESADSANITENESASTVGGNSPGKLRGGDMNLFSLMQHVPWLRDQLARMLAAALRGRDPEVYAALLMEELPEGLEPHVVGQLLSRSDWFQQICQLVPQWNDARAYPWLEHVRNLILQSLTGSGPSTQDLRPDVASTVPPGADARADHSVRPAPKPARGSGEVDRPTRLPSLTGD